MSQRTSSTLVKPVTSLSLPQSVLDSIPGERLLALQRRVNTSDWYLPETGARKNGIAQEAYEKAVASFKADLTENEASQILSNKGLSMHDALKAINSSRDLYETKDAKSKTKKWLRLLSSRVVHYGFVLDALAQYDPQYVALAWGAMRFAFTVILGHEELITNIAKTLAQIAVVLPRTQLAASLYQTVAIADAIGQLYYHIIVFFEKSFKFYKKSRFARALTALGNPYALEFKATVDDIDRQSRLLDQMADSAMKAELRDIHTLTYVAFGQILQNNALLSRISQQQPQQPIILMSCITTVIHESLPPFVQDLALKFSISLSKRRKTANPAPRTLSLLIAVLSAWASSPTSKLLIVSSSIAPRDYSKDLAAELIQLLQNQTPSTQNGLLQPVLWVLYKDSSIFPEPIQLIRQLVSQLLLFVPEPNPGIGEIFYRHQNERSIPFTSKPDIAALSIEDWVDIFALLAVACGRIFIIVDLEMICRGLLSVESYLNILRILVGRSGFLVKILVLEFGRLSETGYVERRVDMDQVKTSLDSREGGGVEMFIALKKTTKAKKMMKKGQVKGKGLFRGNRAECLNIKRVN